MFYPSNEINLDNVCVPWSLYSGRGTSKKIGSVLRPAMSDMLLSSYHLAAHLVYRFLHIHR